MPRQLKLFNGRAHGVFPSIRSGQNIVFIAAWSVEDLRSLCEEAGLNVPSTYEIKHYWNKGIWGMLMDCVAIERGIWIVKDAFSKEPVREKIFPKP